MEVSLDVIAQMLISKAGQTFSKPELPALIPPYTLTQKECGKMLHHLRGLGYFDYKKKVVKNKITTYTILKEETTNGYV